MGENAELWVTKENERIALECWLIRHNVKFDLNNSIDELTELYIKKECGEI